MAELGASDIDHIHSTARLSRLFEFAGRLLIHTSLEPAGWSCGVVLLASHFILDSMELGHNILHGQYDWTKDPRFSSKTYRWAFAVDEKQWQEEHNGIHHRYTNVVGKDPDLGYDRFRLTERQPWSRSHLGQAALIAASAVMFDLSIGHYVSSTGDGKHVGARRFLRKAARFAAENYILFPLLAGPLAPKVLAGNLAAAAMRNVFAAAVIYCGHFPDGVETFTDAEHDEQGSKTYFLRQVLGSANFEGGKVLSVMAGHLNYQIEHHLFPRVPAWRYRQLAPRVRAICEKHGVPYNTGSFAAQLGSVVKKILRLSLPGARSASSSARGALAATSA
jgi:fatty acid desaturase